MFVIYLRRTYSKTMYQILTFLHSTLRWLVLGSLLIAIIQAYRGYNLKLQFSPADNAIRHWTATIAHLQLMAGIILYVKSPLVKYFWNNPGEASKKLEFLFFGVLHILLMIIAIVILTIGSALAKRKEEDQAKFKTMFIWFLIALIIILLAIPWPFSPLAHRPYFR